MDDWRLITTWDAPPAWNMALDQALLESPGAPPTLRLYTWRPAALSLGYFQRFDEVPAAQRAACVVRRITGGGAIHHQRELTFSICVDLEHPLYAGTVGQSYARVHASLARALAEFGVQAQPRGEAQLSSDQAGTGMCFHDSSALDLVWRGRKGVGSAQRRKGGRVLHHGSIKLDTTPLEGAIASVADVRAGVAPHEFAQVWLRAWGPELGANFRAGAPDPSERALAKELVKRFEDPGFTRRR